MSSSIEEQIKAIEDEIFNTQKNKATEHHIGKLKAKIARLKDEAEKRKSAGSKGKGFSVKKEGDATVGLIGFPSIGKSTLLNQLTRASSKIGAYDFTTLETIPGVLKYKGADIQILDLPGLIEGASKGKGRGREILSAIRNVDLALLMIDAKNISNLKNIENELHNAGIRLNQKKPDIVLTKKGFGGIEISSTLKLTKISEKMIKSISSEFVINADITIREDITEDQLIDFFSDNRVYVKSIVAINKIDTVDYQKLNHDISQLKKEGYIINPISSTAEIGLEKLKETIYQNLNLIRIFMKPVGKQTDFNEPLILKEGATIENACRKLHKDFIRKFRYATVSGPSAKHDSQRAGLDHKLKDTDILTIVTWK